MLELEVPTSLATIAEAGRAKLRLDCGVGFAEGAIAVGVDRIMGWVGTVGLLPVPLYEAGRTGSGLVLVAPALPTAVIGAAEFGVTGRLSGGGDAATAGGAGGAGAVPANNSSRSMTGAGEFCFVAVAGG
jgi:hypothetical protein